MWIFLAHAIFRHTVIVTGVCVAFLLWYGWYKSGSVGRKNEHRNKYVASRKDEEEIRMNETFMKEKPVLPLLLSMSLPMVISMMVNSLYNIVDSFLWP